jgi:hypothetical protein
MTKNKIEKIYHQKWDQIWTDFLFERLDLKIDNLLRGALNRTRYRGTESLWLAIDELLESAEKPASQSLGNGELTNRIQESE